MHPLADDDRAACPVAAVGPRRCAPLSPDLTERNRKQSKADQTMSSSHSVTDRTPIRRSVEIALQPSRYRKTYRQGTVIRLTTTSWTAPSRVKDGPLPRRGHPGAQRPPRQRGARSALFGLSLTLFSLVAPICTAADPQASLALFQHLIETAPGEFEVRAFSLSAASGANATATVTTFTDQNGMFRGAATGAATAAGVNSGSPFQVLAPEDWKVDTAVGQSVSPAP